jgi:hypothetical protein
LKWFPGSVLLKQKTIYNLNNIYQLIIIFNKHIRENLSNFEVPRIRTASKKRTHLSLAKKVETKVADFDIRGAIK